MKSKIRIWLAGGLALVVALTCILWFPTPADAIHMRVTDLPGTAYTNQSFYFQSSFHIWADEALPIDYLELIITGDDYTAVAHFDTLGNIIYQSGEFLGIEALETPYYGMSIHSAYGYGYMPQECDVMYRYMGYGYFDYPYEANSGNPDPTGYQWGYGYGVGPMKTTQGVYKTRVSTVGMPAGIYNVKLVLHTGYSLCDEPVYLSEESEITLRNYSGGGGGSIPLPDTYIGKQKFPTVGLDVDSKGKTISVTSATNLNGNVELKIPIGTTILDANGNPVETITAVEITDPPEVLEGDNIISIPYDFGPNGTTFDPPIELTYHIDSAMLPEGYDPNDLSIAYYDEETGAWVEIPATYNEATGELTAMVSHFTAFAVIAPAPADISVGAVTVNPAEGTVQETITISAVVSNNGRLSGDYTVTFKLNNTVISSKDVTVAGSSSETVDFTTVGDAAGNYTVDINGEAAQFSIKEAAAEPTSTPTPTATPTPADDTTGGISGWLIAVIVAVVVIIVAIIMSKKRKASSSE